MPRHAKRSSGRSRGAYLLLVLAGCYAITWTFAGFVAIGLSLLGLVRSEAVIISSLLSFLFYPALAMITLAAARPVRLWLLLVAISVLLELLVRSWRMD